MLRPGDQGLQRRDVVAGDIDGDVVHGRQEGVGTRVGAVVGEAQPVPEAAVLPAAGGHGPEVRMGPGVGAQLDDGLGGRQDQRGVAQHLLTREGHERERRSHHAVHAQGEDGVTQHLRRRPGLVHLGEGVEEATGVAETQLVAQHRVPGVGGHDRLPGDLHGCDRSAAQLEGGVRDAHDPYVGSAAQRGP